MISKRKMKGGQQMMMTAAEAMSRTWLEVDENGLLDNYREALSLCGDSTSLIAVLKADAYGYCAERIAQVLAQAGCSRFAVACLPEAMEIRRVLPNAFILNLGVTPAAYLETAIKNNIRMAAASEAEIRAISQTAQKLGRTAIIHIKLDTGLHRLGFVNVDRIPALIKLPHIEAEGVFSHLALRGRKQSTEQNTLFQSKVAELKRNGAVFPIIHLVDSIGLTRYNDWKYDAARIGAFLYGNVPPDYAHFYKRKAVGRFCTRVSRIETIKAGEGIGYDDAPLEKDTRVATLAAGYVDGYARSLSGVGEVEICGRRARVLGLVCMDQMMVNISEIPEAQTGDIAILLGGGISLNEYAAWGRLNRNEATSMIGRRVPRIYIRDGKIEQIISRIEV